MGRIIYSPYDYVLRIDGRIDGNVINPERIPDTRGEIPYATQMDGSAPWLMREILAGNVTAGASIGSWNVDLGEGGRLFSISRLGAAGFDDVLPCEYRFEPMDRVVSWLSALPGFPGGIELVYRGVKMYDESAIYLGPEKYEPQRFVYRTPVISIDPFIGPPLAPAVINSITVQLDNDADFALEWMGFSATQTSSFTEVSTRIYDTWGRRIMSDWESIGNAFGGFPNRYLANPLVYKKEASIVFDLRNWSPGEGAPSEFVFTFGGEKRYAR